MASHSSILAREIPWTEEPDGLYSPWDPKKIGHDFSLVAQTVKRLSAMQETRVWSLGWEDPLEKEMATHSITLPGESHGGRSLVGYVHGVAESDATERLCFHFSN